MLEHNPLSCADLSPLVALPHGLVLSRCDSFCAIDCWLSVPTSSQPDARGFLKRLSHRICGHADAIPYFCLLSRIGPRATPAHP